MSFHNKNFTVENYLKALLNIASPTGEVSATDLAEALQVSLPTVHAMMKRLHDLGYVSYERYKPLRITEKCRKEAALIIRKHRLTEMYLVEKMGIGWEAVHEIAEQIEHIQSPLLFERMDEILGRPAFDPHGSPIPDKDGNMVYQQYRLLSDCSVGESVKLRALKTSSEPLLKYLNSKCISLGAELTIIKYEEFDGSMWISVNRGEAVHLSPQATKQLCVE